MKRTTVLLTLGSLLAAASVCTGAMRGFRSGPLTGPGAWRVQAPPQSAVSPQWQSRAEYDAFGAITTQAKDPEAQIALAEAFLQRFPRSAFKPRAYLIEMTCYYRLKEPALALAAARKTLKLDPDNLEALSFQSDVFPLTFPTNRIDPTAAKVLTLAEDDARHGLRVLQGLQKPENESQEEFRAYVLSKRASFNSLLGFAALQRKDYASAIGVLRTAVDDNPNDMFAFYRLGLAYLYSTPSDCHHGIWYVARAAGLARKSHNPFGDYLLSYLRQVFDEAIGSDAALEDTVNQAVAHIDPKGSGHVGPHRPRRPSGQGTSTGSVQAASGKPPSGQTNLGGSYPAAGAIYPGWLPEPPDTGENPPSAETGNWPPPPPSPVELEAQITEQVNNQVDLRLQQQAQQDAESQPGPDPLEPEPAPLNTVLVYKDGHQMEVQNYAIMGENLVWFAGELKYKVPLEELDLPATRKINEDHGLAFVGPSQP